MHPLTHTCALFSAAVATIALLNTPRPAVTAAPEAPAAHVDVMLERALGDYQLEAGLNDASLPKGSIIGLRGGENGYVLRVPAAASDASFTNPVRVAFETTADGAPAMVLTQGARTVRAHRVEAVL